MNVRLADQLPANLSGAVEVTFETVPGLRGHASLFTGNVAVDLEPPAAQLPELVKTAHYVIGFCLLAGTIIESTGPMTTEMVNWLQRGTRQLHDWADAHGSSRTSDALCLIDLSRSVGPGVPFPASIRDFRTSQRAKAMIPTVRIGGTFDVRTVPDFWSSISPIRDGFGFLDRRLRVASLMVIVSHHLFLRTQVLRAPEQQRFFDRAAHLVAWMQSNPQTRSLGFQRWFGAAATAYRDTQS